MDAVDIRVPTRQIRELYTFSASSALTRGPGQLKPSDSSPVLQYVSGPSSDFLAKILGVETLYFLCNT
jgi:hypothetical protein